MGSSPSTHGIRHMTVSEAVQGMPRRTLRLNQEMATLNNNMALNQKSPTTAKDQIIAADNKIEVSKQDAGQTNHLPVDKESIDKGEEDSQRIKESKETEDKQVALSVQKKKEDEDEDPDEEKKPRKKLTEEEIAEMKQKFVEKCEQKMLLLTTTPPRDLDQEGAPYTNEFRQCLLVLAKSYFYLKLGTVPYPTIVSYRNELTQLLCKHGTIKIMCDVLSDGLRRRDYMGDSGKMVNNYWFPMKNIVLSLLNFSDCSDDVKTTITDHPEVVALIVMALNDSQKAHANRELTEDHDKMIKWSLSILHNCGSMEENVPRLRELEVIKVCIPYLDSHNSLIRLSSIALLADLVNEEEAEILGTRVSIFRFILKKLGNALKTENHKDLGWSAAELTRAIGKLARNDANKKVLVNEGCLPLLVSLMKTGDEDEIKESLSCLWALSFDDENKKKMVEEPDLVPLIYGKYCSSDRSTKHACHGILWSLREELAKSEGHKAIGEEIANFKVESTPKTEVAESPRVQSADAVKFEGHVMVSYQWGNQEVIKQITQELRAHGIPVWIDIDYMGGSTLQAMAKAVEDSFLVIIAMSQKYKDSPNTRAEAEYAFQQRKKIIPLIMQRGYRPDGWLGLILGSKLFYDFSGKYSFESRMEGLLKAVLIIAKSSDKDIEQPLVPSKAGAQHAVPPSSLPALTTVSHPPAGRAPPVSQIDEETIKKWSKDDVTKWLTKYNLQQSSLVHLTGEEIVFMHNLRQEAPEFFYHCLEVKLNLTSILELSNATKALNDLTF